MHRIMEDIKLMKTNHPPMKAPQVAVDHKEATLAVVTKKE
tara:strand:+ start:167 stop:286 length:120 start_codon:yes stop_codon:yes gene_type:complete